MPTAPFVTTHLLHVTGRGRSTFIEVHATRDDAGNGPAWSREAWSTGADADFRASPSRWIALDEALVVGSVLRALPPRGAPRPEPPSDVTAAASPSAPPAPPRKVRRERRKPAAGRVAEAAGAAAPFADMLAADFEEHVRDRIRSFSQDLTDLMKQAAVSAVAEALGGDGSRAKRRRREPG